MWNLNIWTKPDNKIKEWLRQISLIAFSVNEEHNIAKVYASAYSTGNLEVLVLRKQSPAVEQFSIKSFFYWKSDFLDQRVQEKRYEVWRNWTNRTLYTVEPRFNNTPSPLDFINLKRLGHQTINIQEKGVEKKWS